MYLSDTPLRIIISNNSNKEYEIITVIHLFINNKIYSLKFFSSKPYCNIFHLFVDFLNINGMYIGLLQTKLNIIFQVPIICC